jgi:hypothetical protein
VSSGKCRAARAETLHAWDRGQQDPPSSAAYQRYQFQPVGGGEWRFGVLATRNDPQVKLHSHVPRIEPQLIDERGDRRSGLDLAQLAVKEDLHGAPF